MKVCSVGYAIPFPDYYSSAKGFDHLKRHLEALEESNSVDFVRISAYEVIIYKVEKGIPLTLIEFQEKTLFPSEYVEQEDAKFEVIHDATDQFVRVVYPDNFEGQMLWEIEKKCEARESAFAFRQDSLYDIAVSLGYRGSEEERQFPKLMSWTR